MAGFAKNVLAGCFLGALSAGLLGGASVARGVVVANFEDGTTDGVGYLTSSSGVKQYPESPGPTVAVVTPTGGTAAGTDTSQVFALTGAGYNGGQSGGTDVGYDFAANGFASQFLANDILTFNWELAAQTATGGYAQLYQIVLNAPGGGYTAIGGTSTTTGRLESGTSTDEQDYSFTGQVNTVSINYDSYKSAITANPGYIQLGIVTNNGGGAPGTFYFDNFTLSTVPEPMSAGLLGMATLGLLGRRRRDAVAR